MIKHTQDIYYIYDLQGYSELEYNPPYDITNAKEAIDKHNQKLVENGFSAKQWLIVKKQSITVFENKEFVMSTIIKTAVEKYPKQV